MKILTTEQQAKSRTRRLRKKLSVGEFQEHPAFPSAFASIASITPWIRPSITGLNLSSPRAGALAATGKSQIRCPATRNGI